MYSHHPIASRPIIHYMVVGPSPLTTPSDMGPPQVIWGGQCFLKGPISIAW